MTQIFLICTCGLPNPVAGLDPALLDRLKNSSSTYYCSTCGEQLSNGAAFTGHWFKCADGHWEVREQA
jgi:hypothetical protein